MRWTKSAAVAALTLAAAMSACANTPRPDVDPPHPALVTSPATPATSATTPRDPYAGAALIDHVHWTDTDQGPRLQVFPTAAGRADTVPAARDRAWREVRTLATRSGRDADSAGMADQFFCHWDWARVVAPDKPSWNLEPWRPAPGYQATVNAFCNPGGPEHE